MKKLYATQIKEKLKVRTTKIQMKVSKFKIAKLNQHRVGKRNCQETRISSNNQVCFTWAIKILANCHRPQDGHINSSNKL